VDRPTFGRVRGPFDVQPAGVGLGPARKQDLTRHGRQVERLSPVEARLTTREREERFDEPLLLDTGGEHPLVGRAEGVDRGLGIGQRHLRHGALAGERRAQLVGGVGDELALGLEGGLQPGEEPRRRSPRAP
jgi:hypothetical protein